MDLFKLTDTDATDFAKRAGCYQDAAIRNPVVVSKNGRPKTVLVAYDEFIRLRERDRRSFTVDDIPDDIADAILSAEVPKGLTDTDWRRPPTLIPSEPPIAGTVIRYAFLWSDERREGLESAREDRPAVLVIARKPTDGSCIVVPSTHREPEGRTVGLEIFAEIWRRVGLDDRRQWVIVSEGNAFVWPGPDLRFIPDLDPPSVTYGTVPRRFFALVLALMQTLIRARRLAMSPRR